MNIKDQILLSVILSLILVVAISGSIVVSYLDMQETQHQEDIAADVVRGAYELTYLSSDYLVNADPRARTQWEERYASLQTVISQLKPGNQEEMRSIGAINEYNEQIGVLFREIPEPGTLSAGANLFPPGYQQVMWSRNGVQLQGLIYEAWRLRHLYHDDTREARNWNNILVVALMVSMFVIISVNYLFISRRLMRSIRDVNDGIARFASGNLGYRIPVTSDDEIGGIAHGLNTMADHIQGVTASRDELNQEVEERKRVEDALRESEERFRTMADWTNDWEYWTKNQDREVVYCSPSAERITGYSADEFIADKSLIDRLVYPDDRALWEDHLPSHIEDIPGDNSLEIDFRITARDGTIHWIGHTCRSIYAWDGAWVGRRISNRDITDRKIAENALRESEERFRETVKSLDEAYYSTTLEGVLLEHNVAFNRILGIDRDRDLKGTGLPDFWQHPEDRRVYINELLTKGVIQNYTINARTARGEKIIVLANSHLVRDSAGSGTRIEGVFTDVTILKQAEDALKASEEKFSMAFRTSPYAITITRARDGQFIDVNPAFTVITGYSTEEALASSSVGLDLWVNAEDRKRVVSALLEGRSVDGQEFLFRKKNGEQMTGLFSARMVTLINEPCILSSINDISGRKQSELQRESLIRELEVKNAELERFTYTVSHDLKSPLITIRGFLGLLREDALKGDTGQMDRDISRIASATDKMQALLSDLLTLSRIGRVINPPERVNFATIAEEARELLAGAIQEHGFTVRIDPDLPDVFVDRTRIREVLINLIENAIKFRGDNPGPLVEIGVHHEEDRPVFYVRDNGIGIEPQYLTRIFNLFEKLDPKTEGTGVGLPIVKRIIEVHGGTIWVESAGPGQGTTFWFTLPPGVNRH